MRPASPVTPMLLEARRGTAYFSRILGEMNDDRLQFVSSDGVMPHAEAVARVAVHARSLAEVFEAARSGVAYRPHAGDMSDEAVRFTSTLNPGALRNLHAHSVVHLNVEWRDLPTHLWDAPVTLWDGSSALPAALVHARRHLVWTAALALDPLGRTDPLPRDLRPVTPGLPGGNKPPS